MSWHKSDAEAKGLICDYPLKLLDFCDIIYVTLSAVTKGGSRLWQIKVKAEK